MTIEHPAPGHLSQLRRLWQQVFGDSDDFLDSFWRTAYAPDRCRCILMDGTIAAVLYWIDCTLENRKLAYIYAVATHPRHRGKGLCRALMADTHRLLESRGYAGAVLQPQDEGLRHMYEKMGYRSVGGMDEITCTADGDAVSLQAIGPAEFAARRRTLLPDLAVIQEGAGLAFLAEQLQFYAGADFLLAGFAGQQTFHGMELLGNTAAAPGILKSLHCQQGIFRIPGTAPFAMFHGLIPDAPSPGYFGFPFD